MIVPRGASPPGKQNQPLRFSHLKSKCTRPSCDYWQPPDCVKQKTDEGCKFREHVCFFIPTMTMHMMRKTDLSPEELETVKVSRRPTTVITANGFIDTSEEARVHVKGSDMFVTVQLLEDTPAELSLEKLCEENESVFLQVEWTNTKSYKDW